MIYAIVLADMRLSNSIRPHLAPFKAHFFISKFMAISILQNGQAISPGLFAQSFPRLQDPAVSIHCLPAAHFL